MLSDGLLNLMLSPGWMVADNKPLTSPTSGGSFRAAKKASANSCACVSSMILLSLITSSLTP